MAKTYVAQHNVEGSKVSKWRFFLPNILAFLTNTDRYLPDLDWSDKSLTHNFFRAYEWLCFRRAGVRAEVSVIGVDGQCYYFFHTVESAIAHFEGLIRGLVPKFSFQRVYIPVLQPVGGYGVPQVSFPYLFAIAVETPSSQYNGSNATSHNFSLTLSGSNRVLVAGARGYSTTVTSFTWNGSEGLTSVGTSSAGSDGTRSAYLIAPSTGTANLTVAIGGSTRCDVNIVNFSGAKQSAQPDSSGATYSTSTPIAQSVTIVDANSMAVGMLFFNGGSEGGGGNTNWTQSSIVSGRVQCGVSGLLGTGSQSISVGVTGGGTVLMVVAIAPVPAVDVTANAGVVTSTFSTPAPAISGGALVSQGTPPVATFSTPAPAITGDANVTASVVTATFSTPAPNIITPDSHIDASVVTATFSLPAPTVAIDTQTDVGVLTATFSLPASSVQIDFTHSANVQVATFSLPTPTIIEESNVTISATVVTATFSTPATSVTAEQNAVAEPSVLTATFSTPEVTVTAIRNISVDAGVVTATFSTNAPTKVGGLWTAQPRDLGAWTPQPRAI